MSSSIYQSIRERATPESVMLVLMLVVSSYMLLESTTFSREVALFPRFAAIVTICGILLLLLQRYLPETLQAAVSESSTMFDQTESVQEVEEQARTRTDEPGPGDDPEHDEQYQQLLLVGLLAVYGVVGYVIGLVLATPIFLALYVVMFDVKRTIGVALIVVGIAIALAFDAILPVNLMEGQLW
ncbi:tripartite tricarboxylate transporter TctB family protein [Natrarchaeobaculum aegyptiacum]|uniref:DUF1468 domain-containing protein n=1 Tax=Natrarchaeobaculum aegyptiacum TaxID=745377 RepID=A0A2Z2HYV0_9EURY|nr:tripartite tricarboxylate transporter TctB family protein [Natrarchaeobaculum aegyptiacum]ARS91027.1 hypothetical protein B1756_15665 [Natrarchaeobaculum aegyptiacum]